MDHTLRLIPFLEEVKLVEKDETEISATVGLTGQNWKSLPSSGIPMANPSILSEIIVIRQM